jgi:hypothetical protein
VGSARTLIVRDWNEIMPILKGIVIAMGVLIVAGMGLLAYGVATKVRTPAISAAGAPSALPQPPTVGFGTLPVPVPKGCAFGALVADGDRAYLRLISAGAVTPTPACERIIVLDVARGRVLGTIVPSDAGTP